ncbi:MAG: deoxyribonuclease IV [Nitrospirae bacterium]|nr:deoxyribonuclease IV [Nitrospirota bacterium]
MRRLGVHVSIAGGSYLSFERAKELGCTSMQIFSHNPRGWFSSKISHDEAEKFRQYSKTSGIEPVFIHASYLINLSSPDNKTRERSIELLAYELHTADLLGIDYVVLHPGKAVGQDKKTAIKKASEALSFTARLGKYKSGILLENTAGQRGDISASIQDIAEIAGAAPAGLTGLIRGICFDTCHAYAAGYDIVNAEGLSKLKDETVKYLSPLKIKLIHLNDAKKGFSSGVDRHEHIGEGSIGIEGFKKILSFPFFRDIPLILETPKLSEEDDKGNLKKVWTILKETG